MLRSASELARDGGDWAERAEFWRTFERANGRGGKKKFKFREPLILCGHGVRIRVDHKTLLIRNGLTHFPQKAEEIRLFPGDAQMPDRIVVIDGSGGLTFDALEWMSEQNVEFIRLDWRGEISSIGGKSGYSANPRLVEKQREIRGTQKELEIAAWLIREKLLASVQTLKTAIPELAGTEIAISRIQNWLAELKKPPRIGSISKILGIEGPAARDYFQAWHGIPLKWTTSRRKPIPENWREFGPRTMGWKKRASDARHPINAMLNYGYGILANRVRGNVIAAGLDSSIGIIHGSSQNPIPLVYDLMEPLRPLVDRIVLQFALAHEFMPGDFTISKLGGCRLNPQLASSLADQIALRNEPNLVTNKYKTTLVRQTRKNC